MNEKYTGAEDDRRYTSEAIDVTYNLRRCIHAEECVNRLHEVFDTQKRPWIQPGNAAADAVVEVISLCPSGALHTERHDGGAAEAVPVENVIVVHQDSYYQFIGDVEIQGSNVAIDQEVRAALCRCGLSENKPFCDNNHEKGFEAPAAMVDLDDEKTALSGGKLRVTVHENGSIEVNGNFELRDEKGNTIHHGSNTWLCRCGESSKKPFCDGTHKKIGFTAL
jgi:CDGSH-type Zn-finger protein/uncharacterized Fe-S cluster protein YjdI